MRSSSRVRPGDGPVVGPLAAAAVCLDDWAGRDGVHLLYADLDLAERAGLRRALGLGPDEPLADVDLVLRAYRQWGPDAADHLGGQFAVAVWDGERQAVVATRDPVGLRPLFYAAVSGGLVVGGDVRAVLGAEGVPDALDEDVMAAVLLDVGFRPVSVGRTCYRAVDELRGGHRLTAGASGPRVERTWRPEDAPALELRGVDEIGEALRAILREVAAEAAGSEPAGTVGVHLSSGIDSATVAAFAAEALAEAGGPPPVAFPWQPPPGAPPAPEYVRIEAVARRWSLPVVWCPATADDYVAGYGLDPACDPVTMWAPEEPVRRAARAHGVQTILSGWGGDEATSFSGRSLVTASLLRRGRWGPVAAVAARDPVYAAQRLWTWRARRGWIRKQSTLDGLRTAAFRGEHPTLVRADLLRRAELPEPERPPEDLRAYMAWLLRRGHLGARAGSWARAGAAHGLRYRYPLLDRRVLVFVLGLPEEAWLPHRRRRRWPLRAAGAGLVPDVVRLDSRKAEPAWTRASQGARRQAAARVAPLVTAAAASDRAAYVDVDAVREALAEWLRSDGANAERRRHGLHALSYLGLGS